MGRQVLRCPGSCDGTESEKERHRSINFQDHDNNNGSAILSWMQPSYFQISETPSDENEHHVDINEVAKRPTLVTSHIDKKRKLPEPKASTESLKLTQPAFLNFHPSIDITVIKNGKRRHLITIKKLKPLLAKPTAQKHFKQQIDKSDPICIHETTVQLVKKQNEQISVDEEELLLQDKNLRNTKPSITTFIKPSSEVCLSDSDMTFQALDQIVQDTMTRDAIRLLLRKLREKRKQLRAQGNNGSKFMTGDKSSEVRPKTTDRIPEGLFSNQIQCRRLSVPFAFINTSSAPGKTFVAMEDMMQDSFEISAEKLENLQDLPVESSSSSFCALDQNVHKKLSSKIMDAAVSKTFKLLSNEKNSSFDVDGLPRPVWFSKLLFRGVLADELSPIPEESYKSSESLQTSKKIKLKDVSEEKVTLVETDESEELKSLENLFLRYKMKFKSSPKKYQLAKFVLERFLDTESEESWNSKSSDSAFSDNTEKDRAILDQTETTIETEGTFKADSAL